MTGSTQTVSSEDLKQHGCEVRLVPNTSGIYPDVAGSIFIVTKGWEYPFGFMEGDDFPQSCDGSSTVSVPLHLAHSAPLTIVKGCLGK
jgi:hypothetical protein